MENENKICPILSANTMIETKDGKTGISAVPYFCVHDNCAWWVEDKQKCSIAVLPPRK